MGFLTWAQEKLTACHVSLDPEEREAQEPKSSSLHPLTPEPHTPHESYCIFGRLIVTQPQHGKS